jgi:5-hydroxyisourate hydrolase
VAITTHVLDTSRGKPAPNVGVKLEVRRDDQWVEVGRGETDADGRCKTLTPGDVEAGIYRLCFDTGSYYRERHTETFFPETLIVFTVADAAQHYHVPLLLSPFGYSTYRGT